MIKSHTAKWLLSTRQNELPGLLTLCVGIRRQKQSLVDLYVKVSWHLSDVTHSKNVSET